LHSIAHIINPFITNRSSDLFYAQPITFKSILNAKEKAKDFVTVDLLTAQYEEDRAILPEGFYPTKNLEYSVLDFNSFERKVKLPFIADILDRLYTESVADYLIYTNVDIGLFPDFYLKVNEFINQGYDAFIINRRRISSKYNNVSQLDSIYTEVGEKHPGFDCFVFHRSLFPKFKLQGICIGVPFIEISFSQNLFAFANNFKLFEREQLTFHIGKEIFKKRMPREYFWYNRRKFHAIEQELLPNMNLKKFPFAKQFWPFKTIKWLLHPCIPTRLVIKLQIRDLKRGLGNL
jgi:hypothetical protein